MVTWKDMPRSLGHVFYDRFQGVLIDAGFDAFAETACKPYYAAKMYPVVVYSRLDSSRAIRP